MAEQLIGSRDLPPFNILDMIMSGPKAYFGRRGTESDLLWMQQQEQQRSGAFAKGLLGTPEFNAAVDNPYDRRKQFGLWALTQGGPQGIATQGADWLKTGIAGAYNREQTSFEDALAKSRLTMGTDEALRLEAGKIKLQNDQFANQFQMVFGTDPNTGESNAVTQMRKDAAWTMAAKSGIVPDLPAGYSIGTGMDGQMTFVPRPGGEVWQKSMTELGPLQQMMSGVDELTAMYTNKAPWETGKAQQLVQQIKDGIRTAGGFGSLDAGTQEALNNYLADISSGLSIGGYNPLSSQNLYNQEKLRGLKLKVQREMVNWQRKYQIPIGEAGDPYHYQGPSRADDAPPIPKGSADDAMKTMQDRSNLEAQPNQGRSVFKTPRG